MTELIERDGVALEQWQWDALDAEPSGPLLEPESLLLPKVPSWVYFIEEENGLDAVKIGVAAEPYGRIAGLQTGNPRRLILRELIIADVSVETRLHRLWTRKGAQIRDEWFGNEYHDAILVLARHIAGAQLEVCKRGRLVEQGLQRCIDDGLHRHREVCGL